MYEWVVSMLTVRCKEFANLIVTSTESEMENISDAAILRNVYEVTVISGWANTITAYTIRDERMRWIILKKVGR